MSTPSFLTHAKCIHCLHIEGRVFWFKKPIKRCPRCKSQLRQVPHHAIEKRIYLEKLKLMKIRKKKIARVRKWESKHKREVKEFKASYWKQNAKRMKQDRIADGRYAKSLKVNSDYQKKHLIDILKRRREKNLILRQMRIPMTEQLVLVSS